MHVCTNICYCIYNVMYERMCAYLMLVLARLFCHINRPLLPINTSLLTLPHVCTRMMRPLCRV